MHVQTLFERSWAEDRNSRTRSTVASNNSPPSNSILKPFICQIVCYNKAAVISLGYPIACIYTQRTFQLTRTPGGARSDKMAASGQMTSSSPPWDPTTSPDWDGEKHSREAIHRIKGYLLVGKCFRDFFYKLGIWRAYTRTHHRAFVLFQRVTTLQL